jgi:hypothetical protein
MRRTTIFRSKLLPALVALVIAHGVAWGQDTTQVAPVDPAPAVQGSSHIVQTGETLWGLAEQYLGDPLLWPAIYRLNTLVVEDPHWIFPGEELRLVPPDSTMLAPGAQVVSPLAGGIVDTSQGIARGAVGADTITGSMASRPGDTTSVGMPVTPGISAADLAPPPPPPGSGTPTIFAPRPRTEVEAIESARGRYLRPVSASDFYAAGFLTERDRLPWADVLGAAGKPQLGALSTVTSARVFEQIEIKPANAATYQVGDTLLVASLPREIPSWGDVVVPSALARVRESTPKRVVADVLMQFNRVVSGQVAMPVEPFRNPGPVFPTPIDNGMTGTIIDVRDRHPLPGQMNVLFLDRGREDGLAPGDVFEVLRPNPPEASPETPLRQVAVVQVVHVRQRSSSALLLQISDLGVSAGAPVRLIRKMPS